MEPQVVEIKIYDKRLQMSSTIYVEQLSENTFRAVENEIFNCRLTIGTEFQTRLNEENQHEIIRILKDSVLVTRRFFLSSKFNASDYRLLGDEIMKNGGYWQVDFGGIVSVSLPKDCKLDLDEIFRMFDFWPTEIKE